MTDHRRPLPAVPISAFDAVGKSQLLQKHCFAMLSPFQYENNHNSKIKQILGKISGYLIIKFESLVKPK